MEVTFTKPVNEKKFHLPKWLSFLKNPSSDFYYYLFMVGMGLLFFAASIFTQYFTTPLSGDYNSQQFAFYTNGYDDWWRFFTTGEFTLYDTNTFLGASNIGSNSFYYLFDPFFMPVLLFPRVAIPQAMAIMTIFKMALAGLLFSKYLRYIGISKKTSRVSGLAYAFCGWTAWYLWFNHFTGVAVLFPLVLFGVEKVLKEKKPWLLMISIALLGFCNFFFFFTFTVCAFLYAMFRFFQDLPKKNWRDNLSILGIGFIGFLAGCLIGMVVVLPAMIVALHAPRAENTTYLKTLLESLENRDFATFFRYVFNWESQNTSYRTYYPIINFIFPTMTNRGTPLTKYGNDSYDNVAGSLFCYMPFVMFLVPALISSAKKKHFSVHIATAIFVLMLFTPFVYFAFHGFTYAYSRWNLFVTTSLIAYVSFYIDRIKEEPKWHMFVGMTFGVGMVWAAVMCAIHIVDTNSSFSFRYSYKDQFGEYGFVILEGILASLYLLIIGTIFYFRKDKKSFDKLLMLFISAELTVMGALTLEGHGYSNYLDVNNGYNNNAVFQQVIDQIKRDDPTYYRCYSSQENSSARNDSMRHNYNGLGMFHSVYNFNDYAFLNWSNINDYEAPGSYSASYVEKRQNLDTFLGVKYYFIHKDKAFWGDEKAQAKKYQYYRANVPLGFIDITDQYPNSQYYVYKNTNFIDFAFSFDKATTYKYSDEEKKKEPGRLLNDVFQSEELYLKRAILNPDSLEIVKEEIPNIETTSTTLEQTRVSSTRLNAGNHYSVAYYDIHGDAEKNRQDCSAYSFVSQLLDLSSYTKSTTKPATSKYNGRYVTVLSAKSNFPYDENGMVFYLKNTYMDVNRINVYFTTEVQVEGGGTEERFLTFDNHNDSHLSNNWTSRKNWRGFAISSSIDEEGNFVPAPKIKNIIICARRSQVYSYLLEYEGATSVQERINTLKQNPITDVKYRENHFDFKTNFNSKRVVVTQLPYEDGWTVKSIKSDGTKRELKVFKAQGGFVSFVSEVGDTSYEMDFYTPYLKEGSLLSLVGEFIFASTLIAYYLYKFYQDDKKNKESLGYRREAISFIGELKKEANCFKNLSK